MTWKKVQNRYYKKIKNEHGVDMIVKATKDSETGEYSEVQRYVASDFKNLSNEDLDENTKLNKAKIIKDIINKKSIEED